MKNIIKIVITGGPCAGKTTALESIKKTFSEMGYAVIPISETATELISSGIAPWTLESTYEFQRTILNLQRAKEIMIETAVKTLKNYDKVLIVCDRGVMDNKSYLSSEEFARLISEYELSEDELLSKYDAVFHLVTAAKGAEEFYTLGNNSARTESISDAITIDDKTIKSWSNHPYYKIIDNSTNFEDKIKRLIDEIKTFILNKPSYEIERKFLISYPDLEKLKNKYNLKQVEIFQTYLKSEGKDKIRIRKISDDDNVYYVKTIKRKTESELKRVEIENTISISEYTYLLKMADEYRNTLHKYRYTFNFRGNVFEIDVYPFWKDKAILEVELLSEKSQIIFPKEINIIREVSNENEYKNSNLAKKYGIPNK